MSLDTANLDPANGSLEGQADTLYGYDVNVIDWNDIVSRAVADGNFDFLTADLGMVARLSGAEGPKSFSVTRDGAVYWSSDGRSYFIALGPVESTFGVHDSISVGGQTLYLGSWYGSPPYLIEGALEQWSGTAGNDVMDASFVDINGVTQSDLGQVIDAGDGNNRVYDGAGDDIVLAGSGKDQFFAGAGADSYDGGGGRNDVVDYRLSTEGLIINAIDGSASTGIAAGDTFTNVEKIYGTEFDDVITLGNGVNTARGGQGNDIIFDSDARDFMTGADGVDTFVFGAGDGQRDVIWDFEQGTDLMDISAWGVASFDDLSITAKRADRWIISYEDERLEVVMEGGRTDVTADDFEFAGSPTTSLLTFDEAEAESGSQVSSPINDLFSDYFGLTWSADWVVFDVEAYLDTSLPPLGVDQSLISGTNTLFMSTPFNDPSIGDTISGDDFALISVFATAFADPTAEGPASFLNVSAFDDGQFVGDQEFTLTGDGAQLLEFDQSIFGNVDQVAFYVVEAGTGGGASVSFDNMLVGGIDDFVLV